MYPSCPNCGIRHAIIRIRRTPWRVLAELMGSRTHPTRFRCYGCFTTYEEVV